MFGHGKYGKRGRVLELTTSLNPDPALMEGTCPSDVQGQYGQKFSQARKHFPTLHELEEIARR